MRTMSGPRPPGHRDGVARGDRRPHDLVSGFFQQHFELHHDQGFVFDDDDPQRFTHGAFLLPVPSRGRRISIRVPGSA